MSFGMQERNKSQSRDQRDGTLVLSELTDAQLIKEFHRGNSETYGTLWERHHGAALRVAQATTSRVDAEDIVSESFANIMDAMLRGRGPDIAFRPYLMATVRNNATAMGKSAAGYVELDEAKADQLIDPASSDEAVLQALESSILYRGFKTLARHWQEVLWYSDVEGLPAKETARLMGGGMNAVSVASLAYRAREGLRQAWIREHLAQSPTRDECAWVVDRIPAYKRGKGRTAEQRRVREHSKGCAFCTMAILEATEASRRFMAGVAGVLIGFVAPGGGLAAAAGATPPGTVMSPSVDTPALGRSNTSAGSTLTDVVRSITPGLRLGRFGMSAGKALVGALVVAASVGAAAFGADAITHVVSTGAIQSGGSQHAASTAKQGLQWPFVDSANPLSKRKSDVMPAPRPNGEPGAEITPVPETSHPDPVLPGGIASDGHPEPEAFPPVLPPTRRIPMPDSAGHPEPDATAPTPGTLTPPGLAIAGETMRELPQPVDTPSATEPAGSPNKGKGRRGDHAPAGPRDRVVPAVLATPTVTSVDTGSGLFYPVISGTADPAAAVTVTGFDGQNVQAVVGADGTFRAPALTGLPVGSSVVLVTQTVGGVTSKPVPVNVELRGVNVTGTKIVGNEVHIRFAEAPGTVVEIRGPHGSEPVRRTEHGAGSGQLKVPALWHSAEIVAIDPDGRTGPVTTVSF